MIKRKALSLFLLLSLCLSVVAQNSFPESSPEAQGIPSESIVNMINGWEKQIQYVHSFILLRHGTKVAEGWWDPYKKDDHHVMFSLSKSFTSAAIGFAVQEKLLSINDKVISFFPDDVPANPSENLKAMRIKDLLTMSTGQEIDAAVPGAVKNPNRVKTFLDLPVVHKPGTLFFYNTGATYMLSAILQKVTGQRLVQYLQPRLFDPLNIKAPTWEQSEEGIDYGGFGLFIRTEDIAKFGQLCLQKGMWNGKQLLSPKWIEQATMKQVSNGSNPESNWDQGYGFQFWRNIEYGYRGDGAFGQFCFVLPEFDLVLAITSGTPNMPGVIDVVWKNLLPALQQSKIAENPDALAKLKAKLTSLVITPTEGKDVSPLAKKFSGKVFQLEDNSLGIKTVTFNFNKKSNNVLFTTASGDLSVPSGFNQWIPSVSNLDVAFKPNKKLIASSSAWATDNTFVMNISYKESEPVLKITFNFEGKTVTMEGGRNVGFGETKLPMLKGLMK